MEIRQCSNCTEKPRTPFELYQGIIQYITTSNTSVTLDDCKLVLNWCIAAAHTDAGSTTSWLAYPIEAAISNNPRFYQWTNRRLTTVLGTIPGTTSPSTTIATPASMDWKSMEKHLRAGIVEGLRPVIDAAKQDDLAPSAATSNKGKEYDEQQWYMHCATTTCWEIAQASSVSSKTREAMHQRKISHENSRVGCAKSWRPRLQCGIKLVQKRHERWRLENETNRIRVHWQASYNSHH